MKLCAPITACTQSITVCLLGLKVNKICFTIIAYYELSIILCSEMPCKLKFYRTKNYERKKVSFIISITFQDVTVTSLSPVPHQLLQIPQLILSLLISAYMTTPVTDLHDLCSWLSAQSLPDGWRRHMDGKYNGLIFSNLSVNSSTFMVKLDNNFKWSLSYNGMLVKN